MVLSEAACSVERQLKRQGREERGGKGVMWRSWAEKSCKYMYVRINRNVAEEPFRRQKRVLDAEAECNLV